MIKFLFIFSHIPCLPQNRLGGLFSISTHEKFVNLKFPGFATNSRMNLIFKLIHYSWWFAFFLTEDRRPKTEDRKPSLNPLHHRLEQDGPGDGGVAQDFGVAAAVLRGHEFPPGHPFLVSAAA